MELTSAPSGFYYKPLLLFPPLIPTTVVGVPLNLSHLALNMTLTSKGPAPASEDAPFRMNVKASIMHGCVYSNLLAALLLAVSSCLLLAVSSSLPMTVPVQARHSSIECEVDQPHKA